MKRARRKKTGKTLGILFTYNIGVDSWRKIGILKRRREMYQKFLEAFDRLVLLTYDQRPQQFLKRTKTLIKGKRNSWYYSLFAPFLYRQELKQCDALVTVQMVGAWTAIIARIVSSRPLVVRQGYSWSKFEAHAHNWLYYLVARTTEFWALAFSKKAIVTTAGQKASLSRINLFRTPIEVIPNGIDTRKFKPAKVKQKPRSILFVGRLHEQKNLENLIAALSGSNYRLTIVGEGPLSERLQHLAATLKVTIDWKGRVPNEKLPGLINQHELFILPSHYEGNPKVLLEAMSCGACCLATHVEGNRELIINGRNGLLCGTDARSLKQAIAAAFKRRDRRKLGAAARKTILDGFAKEETIKREIAAIIEVAE